VPYLSTIEAKIGNKTYVLSVSEHNNVLNIYQNILDNLVELKILIKYIEDNPQPLGNPSRLAYFKNLNGQGFKDNATVKKLLTNLKDLQKNNYFLYLDGFESLIEQENGEISFNDFSLTSSMEESLPIGIRTFQFESVDDYRQRFQTVTAAIEKAKLFRGKNKEKVLTNWLLPAENSVFNLKEFDSIVMRIG